MIPVWFRVPKTKRSSLIYACLAVYYRSQNYRYILNNYFIHWKWCKKPKRTYFSTMVIDNSWTTSSGKEKLSRKGGVHITRVAWKEVSVSKISIGRPRHNQRGNCFQRITTSKNISSITSPWLKKYEAVPIIPPQILPLQNDENHVNSITDIMVAGFNNKSVFIAGFLWQLLHFPTAITTSLH